MAESSNPRIDFVIVNYRSEQWLERCLDSIFADPFDGRVLLVDNDRLDADLHGRLRARHHRLEYIPAGANLGFGGANNLGLRHALTGDAEYIALVNPDLWFESGCVAACAARLDIDHALAAVSPLQCDYETDELSEWARKTLGVETAEQARALGACVETPWLEGSCMVWLRSAIEQLAGFDEIYDMYYEDNDLCRRTRRAGWAMGVLTGVRFHHYGGSTTGGRTIQRQARIDVSQAIYILTDPERGLPGNIAALAGWTARRGVRWLRGDNPAFPLWARLILPKLLQKGRMIARKHARDRRPIVTRLQTQ